MTACGASQNAAAPTLPAVSTTRPHGTSTTTTLAPVPTIVTTTTVPTPPSGWSVASVGPRGITALLRTINEPDGPVTVAQFPAATTALHLHMGYNDPPGALNLVPPDAGDAVSTTNAESQFLVGAFNGGFKADAGAGGVMADNTPVTSLVGGFASAVINAHGALAIGTWGRDVPGRIPAIVSVRQNLSMLVVGGQPTSQAAAGPAAWGSVLGPSPLVARSSLGVDAAGNVYYAASERALPIDLADALSSVGVQSAMQLDINPYWPVLGISAAPGATMASDLPGSTMGPNVFLQGWQRDFFTVIAKPSRSCQLTFPGPVNVAGPAAATVTCVPRHIWTSAQPPLQP